MTLAHENKCAMCGKETIISVEHDNKNENKQQQQQQQQENDSISSAIVEQIDGTYYIFDTAKCALMFKKFNSVYGSNFADE